MKLDRFQLKARTNSSRFRWITLNDYARKLNNIGFALSSWNQTKKRHRKSYDYNK